MDRIRLFVNLHPGTNVCSYCSKYTDKPIFIGVMELEDHIIGDIILCRECIPKMSRRTEYKGLLELLERIPGEIR